MTVLNAANGRKPRRNSLTDNSGSDTDSSRSSECLTKKDVFDLIDRYCKTDRFCSSLRSEGFNASDSVLNGYALKNVREDEPEIDILMIFETDDNKSAREANTVLKLIYEAFKAKQITKKFKCLRLKVVQNYPCLEATVHGYKVAIRILFGQKPLAEDVAYNVYCRYVPFIPNFVQNMFFVDHWLKMISRDEPHIRRWMSQFPNFLTCVIYIQHLHKELNEQRERCQSRGSDSVGSDYSDRTGSSLDRPASTGLESIQEETGGRDCDEYIVVDSSAVGIPNPEEMGKNNRPNGVEFFDEKMKEGKGAYEVKKSYSDCSTKSIDSCEEALEETISVIINKKLVKDEPFSKVCMKDFEPTHGTGMKQPEAGKSKNIQQESNINLTSSIQLN